MVRYDDAHPCLINTSPIEAVQEYMRSLEIHAAQNVTQLYRRARQEDNKSSHKDGLSPVFIGYKAHLTALRVIQRHLQDHKGYRKWESEKVMRSDLDKTLAEWEGKVSALNRNAHN